MWRAITRSSARTDHAEPAARYDLHVTGSTISANDASANATLTNVTVSGNTALDGGTGGALDNSVGGTVHVKGTILASNTGFHRGGGLWRLPRHVLRVQPGKRLLLRAHRPRRPEQHQPSARRARQQRRADQHRGHPDD